MPAFPKNPTPKELARIYREGFTGAKCDHKDLEKLMGELRHPMFGVAAYKLMDSGKGKLSLPFLSLGKFDQGCFTERQTTGDCVSHGCRNAIDVTRAVEIDIKKELEEFVARGATEGIYGSRGHGGQGMSCSGAARFVHQKGGLLVRQNYPDIGLDLSVYNSSIGSRWGSRGVPDNVLAEAKKHQVQTVSLVTSVEEARDAIASGYAINVCSGFGFSSTRDKNGFARRSGSWAHAMAWIACNDKGDWPDGTTGLPAFLVQNSWGKWNSGPRTYGQPEGSFWIDYDTAAAMIRSQGAWVHSSVDGFPMRKLPDYGEYHFLAA